MTVRFRRIEDLAAERNKSERDMAKILGDRGIAIVDGFYDSVLFEAVFTAPSKTDGGLSARTGLGAVQSLVEPFGIRVLVHDVHKSQALVFRKGNKNTVVKWQYTSAGSNLSTPFPIRGFLKSDTFTHYFLTSFDGPTAWVISAAQAARIHKKVKDGEYKNNEDSAHILPDLENHETGALQLRLDNNNSRYLLKSTYQLGL